MAIRSADCTASSISQRSAVIGAFRSSHCSIGPASSCSLGGPLLYHSLVVVYFDRGHLCFRNFNPTIAVDVIWVKSFVLYNYSTCVPVKTILCFAPKLRFSYELGSSTVIDVHRCL